MKLTIGMIVKNEEKWIETCLSAIKPILDNVESELIVTDTGSSDKTVEIAKKYTDKVLHFDWIGDFSAARNFGLEKARGDWFMMLDADDIFRSCDHIIDFFNSGEYKKYNSASYISRNLAKDSDNTVTYSDFLVPRMTKIRPETRFEGIVHEYLTTFGLPVKKIDDIADHYGYLFENEEERINKFKRNTDLLLKTYKSEKSPDPMLFVQLYQSYMSIEESEKAYNYIDEGIELAKEKNSITIAALYFHKASGLQTQKRFEESVKVCDEYFMIDKRIRKDRLWADGEMYGIKAQCLYSLERYDEAVNSFRCFFETFRDIANGKLQTYDAHLIGSYLTNDINIMPMYINFLDSCIRSNRANTVDSFLSSFPIKKYSFEENKIFELVGHILRFAERREYNNIGSYYERLDETGRKMLVDELFYKLLCETDKDKYLEALYDISGKSDRIKKKLDIYSEHFATGNATDGIRDYVGKYGINEDIDLIYISLLDKSDISVFLGLPETDMKRCVYLCCRNFDDFLDVAENYSVDSISDPDKLSDVVGFFDSCISMRLINSEDKTVDEKKEVIKKLYCIKNLIVSKLNNNFKDSVSEFEQLAKKVKRNIIGWIEAGSFDKARKALLEYQKIAPNDPDISDISSRLE